MVFQCRVQDLEGLDLRIPTPLAELIAHPLRVCPVVWRADLVGFGGEPLQPFRHLRRIELRVEPLLEGLLCRGRFRTEAEYGRIGRACSEGRGDWNQSGCEPYRGAADAVIHAVYRSFKGGYAW